MPSWVDSTLVEQRIVEAGAVLPAYGAVTGWAALRWLGGQWFDGDAAGRLAAAGDVGDDHIRPQPGIALSEERMNAYEVIAPTGW